MAISFFLPIEQRAVQPFVLVANGTNEQIGLRISGAKSRIFVTVEAVCALVIIQVQVYLLFLAYNMQSIELKDVLCVQYSITSSVLSIGDIGPVHKSRPVVDISTSACIGLWAAAI